jgi:hypothetical protein
MKTRIANELQDRRFNRKRSSTRAGDNADRSKQGSVLVEGVVGILFLLPILLICIVVLIDVLLICFYKQEVGAVANAAVSVATRFQPGAFLTSGATFFTPASTFKAEQNDQILSYVKNGLSAFGLNSDIDKSFQMTYDKHTFFVTVSFKVTGLKLIGMGPIIPPEISLQESATAILPCKLPPGNFGATVNDALHELAIGVGVRSYGTPQQQFRFPTPSTGTFNVHSIIPLQ